MSAGGGGITLLKLGGSLLTDKRGVEATDPETIRALAGAIAEIAARHPGALVVGHGSGSFGHTAARDAGLTGRETRPVSVAVAAGVARAAARLHRRVLGALEEAGAPAFSFPPSACLVAREGAFVAWPAGPLTAALDQGAVPVVYGDLVLDLSGGARVCSTEDALGAVAASLRAAGRSIIRGIWLGRTDGVLDASGNPIPEIVVGRGGIPPSAGPAEGADVTGGMAHRVDRALALAADGIPSWIGDGRDPTTLARIFRGEDCGGTWVRPAPNTHVT